VTLAIIFDLDDTLYHERLYNVSGFRAVGAHLRSTAGVERFAETCVELFERGVRSDMFEHAAATLGVRVDVAELVQVYRGHRPELTLFPDARNALERTRGRYPLGLLTDGYAGVQRIKVAALGIEPFFESLVYSDDLGRSGWKPSPEPYLRTMRNLEGRADRFLYVGDNPTKDFVTAKRLGWRTMEVRRPEQSGRPVSWTREFEADVTVRSLRDVEWESLDEWWLRKLPSGVE
jgi:putative hydrolase of the HAD superfamily